MFASLYCLIYYIHCNMISSTGLWKRTKRRGRYFRWCFCRNTKLYLLPARTSVCGTKPTPKLLYSPAGSACTVTMTGRELPVDFSKECVYLNETYCLRQAKPIYNWILPPPSPQGCIVYLTTDVYRLMQSNKNNELLYNHVSVVLFVYMHKRSSMMWKRHLQNPFCLVKCNR